MDILYSLYISYTQTKHVKDKQLKFPGHFLLLFALRSAHII